MDWPATPNPNRKLIHRAYKAIMKSHHLRIPKYDLPIRLRPWFLIFTCVIMLVLAFLGFTNFSRALPLNDKLLHFLCFAIATGVFYFIFDVEEEARRIWFWRHSGVMFTAFICFFCGGVLSEFVQSMLPYKEFQFGDIVANILGSSTGLWIAYYSERYYRHRREIARLYRPLGMSGDISDDEDDADAGTQLLPTHHTNNQTDASRPKLKSASSKQSRLADVWDAREEVFRLEDSDNEDAGTPVTPASRVPPVNVPKITVTPS